ncbi:hypothetical protein [Pedobacter alluvionis]|uniref:Uncharacterized protein n=1 Tax=Pedobacter alluvionis TaxID=475253 RepID=A0A497Y7P0_9SPHI|nr:hypothetical protein [Pedobacter alluvionis]RLJ79592.1 hypothetical protein BCL90_0297 [Pedobacter alluvionis]TFB30925.1 hypothetical protein E3V97_09860 [Pedobacter alluvionis]
MSNAYLLASLCTSFVSSGSLSPVNDQGSGANQDVMFWLPDGLSSQQYCLGMIACSVSNYNSPTPPAGTSTYIFSLQNDDPNNSLLASPTGFTPVWTCVDNDQPSNLGIYSIDGPAGYFGVGFIAVPDFNSPPQISDYPQLMCVRGDLVNFNYTVSNAIWTDQGSGAPLDVSIWQSPLSQIGIATLWNGYPKSQRLADLSTIYKG